MNPDTLDREWSILTQLLPAGWREAARDLGALRRGRQVSDPDTLLRLILLHVAAGLSLVQASARAKTTGLADISSVALHKRLRSSAAWLHWMASQMYAQSPFRSLSEPLLKRHRMRVVDATHVSEPGSSGANWRVHYVVQLPSLECDFFEVTDASQGETFERVPIAPLDTALERLSGLVRAVQPRDVPVMESRGRVAAAEAGWAREPLPDDLQPPVNRTE